MIDNLTPEAYAEHVLKWCSTRLIEGNNMDMLILVRHGTYDINTKRLNRIGQDQIQKLVNSLAHRVASRHVRLISSPSLRTMDSADIIARSIDSAVIQSEVLWSDNEHVHNTPAALELVMNAFEGVDVLILVTHYEYCQQLPHYFGNEVLNIDIPYLDVGKGEAVVIDCIAKSYYHQRY